MFSIAEKQKIAQAVENVIREINHLEMDNENIRFILHVYGKESWSWADITPNHEVHPVKQNPWNEKPRKGAILT